MWRSMELLSVKDGTILTEMKRPVLKIRLLFFSKRLLNSSEQIESPALKSSSRVMIKSLVLLFPVKVMF